MVSSEYLAKMFKVGEGVMFWNGDDAPNRGVVVSNVGGGLTIAPKKKAAYIAAAQRGVDRVPLYRPVYPQVNSWSRREMYAAVMGFWHGVAQVSR